MRRHDIKSPSGQLLGYLTEEPSGRIVACSRSGQWLGYYDPATDTTRRVGGAVIARGNITAALVMENS